MEVIEDELKRIKFSEISLDRKKYDIVGINDLGEGNAALICEEVEDNFLVFFRLDFDKNYNKLVLDLIEKAPTDRQGEAAAHEEQKDHRVIKETLRTVVIKAKDNFNED